MNGISLGGVYALEAVGFGIIFNVLKFSNFSHGGVVAICAYLGFFISTRIIKDLWIALLLTTVLGGCIGVVGVEKLVFRPIRLQNKPLTYFFVNSSLPSAMLVQQVFFGGLGGATTIPTRNSSSRPFSASVRSWCRGPIFSCWPFSAFVLVSLSLFLRKTRTGIAVRAASTDIYTPALMGVNTDFIISVTFAVAGVLAGVTGFFLGDDLHGDAVHRKPDPQGNHRLHHRRAWMGSLGGGVIAGILLGAGEGLLIAEVGASITPIVIYLSIILLLLVRPQGIARQTLFGEGLRLVHDILH